mgnify:CR=1 FL=1
MKRFEIFRPMSERYPLVAYKVLTMVYINDEDGLEGSLSSYLGIGKRVMCSLVLHHQQQKKYNECCGDCNGKWY